MEFVKLTEDEFKQYSEARDDHNFWQSTSMAHLRAWNGWTQDYIGVKEADRILAAAMISYRPVFLKRTFAQALRGFYIDYHNEELMNFFHKHLLIYLKSINCMYFQTDPYLPYKERDINGDLVQGGFDHSNVVTTFLQLGYKHMGFLTGTSTEREPNWMFVRNIKDETQESLLKEFDHQTRWTINKTRKMGIEVKEITKEELPLFKRIMNHTAVRRGFDDHDQRYYEGLFETFGADGKLKILLAQLDLTAYRERLIQEEQQAQAELDEVTISLTQMPGSKKYNKKKKVLEEQLALVERKQAECDELNNNAEDGMLTLAGATFISVGKEIMYLYSGAYDQYLKFNAPYALQWYMFCYGIEHGFERYNFYGISGIFDKSDEGYGVYEFKRGFQGTVEELIGDFYLYPKPMLYKLYTLLRSIKHKVKG